MNHLTLRGTHREMGFQRGARLAERGLRLLDHVPFPLEAERRAFAAACHPAVCAPFPRRPGGAVPWLRSTYLLHRFYLIFLAGQVTINHSGSHRSV